MKVKNLVFISFGILLVVLITACGGHSTPEDEMETTLAGTADATWVLSALGPEADPTPVFPDSLITLVFDFEARLASGGAGCNHYTARFNIKGSNLSFDEAMATLMACSPDEIMEQETVFLEILSRVKSYQTDGETLTLYTQEGDVLQFGAIK